MSEEGGPEVKLRELARGLRETAARGKTTTIYPDAAETFAQGFTLAADILAEWQRRSKPRLNPDGTQVCIQKDTTHESD